MRLPKWSLIAFAGFWLAACNASYSGACAPNERVSCSCSEGGRGVRVCARGHLLACSCDPPSESTDAGRRSYDDDWLSPGGTTGSTNGSTIGSTSGTAGASWTSNGNTGGGSSSGGSSSEDAGGPVRSTEGVTLLSEGESALIGAFVAEAGALVVLSDAVIRVNLKGEEEARWDAPRALLTAAHDGETLAVADGAVLTALDDETLEETSSGTLIEPCSSSVIMSDSRFVCGAKSDYNRIYYTYDLADGSLLASSKAYSSRGSKIQLAPGQDAFVATDSFGYQLFRLGEDHAAVLAAKSSSLSDIENTDVYTFDADPAEHLINQQGILLALPGSDCDPAANGSSPGCFSRNGTLGTLTGGQVFVAMTSQNGVVYGLVDLGVSQQVSWLLDPPPLKGYLLQSIDVEDRRILTQATYHLPMKRAEWIGLDESAERVLLAYRTGANTTGYEVVLLNLELE